MIGKSLGQDLALTMANRRFESDANSLALDWNGEVYG